MKLPQFIFFDTPALPGAGFVLCTEQPFYIAKVYKFYDADKLQQFKRQYSDWNIVSIPGYNIVLTYATNMMGNFHPPKGPVKETLQAMADFYLKEKIQSHAAAYTKLKNPA